MSIDSKNPVLKVGQGCARVGHGIKPVYRVEGPLGYGPYSGVSFNFLSHHFNYKTHPGPYDDLGLKEFWMNCNPKERGLWQFGFKSLPQLFRWFKVSEIAQLQEKEFFIRQVPPNQIFAVVDGHKQVLFKPRGQVRFAVVLDSQNHKFKLDSISFATLFPTLAMAAFNINREKYLPGTYKVFKITQTDLELFTSETVENLNLSEYF